MRTGTATAIGVIAMFMTVSAAVSAELPTGTISGLVIGAEGQGLPGATVSTVTASDGQPRVVVTGAGGVFRVSDLPEGVYTLDVQLHGFHPSATGGVVVEAGATQRVTVVLASATFRDTMSIRAESTLSTLEAAEIRETGAHDLGQALSRQADIWKVRKGGIANDVVVRGLREDDITVLIDGARVAGACPNRMDPPAFHLDFAELDRVEIASESDRLAAQGSLGGLVNVTTRKPTDGLSVDASVVAGSWGRFNPSATVNYGQDRWAVLAGVSQRSGEPYEDGSGARFTDIAGYSDRVDGVDAYDVLSVWGRGLVVPADNHELTFSLSHQAADDVLYPTLMMDAVYDDTDRFVTGYTWTPEASAVGAVRATAYATRVDHWMTNALRTSAGEAPRGWSMGTMAETAMFGASAEVDVGEFTFGFESYLRNWNVWTEMAGMNYMRQASLPDVDSAVIGVSARWRHAIGAATNLELGARYDWMDSQADADLANTDLYQAYHGVRTTSWNQGGWSVSARLARQLSPGLELAGSLAHATRAPDPRELFFGLKRMGADWVGNPTLDAPESNRLDVSLEWSHDRGSLTA
jgi:iron complex outermembrane receptor protein